MSHNVIVILICIVLAAWSLYHEYRRNLKRNRLLRILAIVIAIGALACLILPIIYLTNAETPGNNYLLLTKGFNKDSLPATGNDSIYTLDRDIHKQFPKSKLVSDLGAVSADLQVYGYGLTKDELAQLGNKSISFHPSPIPDGIVAANWTDQIKAGEFLTVQLRYKNSTPKKYKVLLNGLNTTLDSATIGQSTETSITLQAKPKSTGKMIYNLLVVDGKDTLEHEDIPVFITTTKPLNVLILSASPGFETKFLKNWLTENAYDVASRTSITKGKFSQEFINIAQTDITHISAPVLSKFDVLISDQSVLQSLNTAENTALQQAVFEKGMGVIMRADSAGKSNSWLQRELNVSHIIGKQPVATAISLQGNYRTAKLTTDPLFINNRNNIQVLATDEQQHILTAAALAGAGKLVFTTLNNTHNWLLAGNKNDYDALWTLLLNNATRKTQESEGWKVQNSIPVINQPVNLQLENSEVIKNIEINVEKVHPATDATSLFKKNITYWPAKVGWQEVVANNGTYKWYTWGENSWESLKAVYKQGITNQYVKQYSKNLEFSAKNAVKSRENVPKIYFFILFLMAGTFLWAEPKFFAA